MKTQSANDTIDSRSSQANILIVDDEAGIRFFLEEALSRDGHRVVSVGSGEAALERLAIQRFDLAIIDLNMKGMGGMQLLTALRRQFPQTIAIILTAHASLGTAVEALRQGAHDYLFKPCKTEDLRQSIRSGLIKRQRDSQIHAQTDLIADISHELRNPIASITLLVQMLEMEEQNPKSAQRLQMLREETKRLRNLLEDTLTMSALEKNGNGSKATSTFKPVDLNGLVQQTIPIHQQRAEAEGLEMVLELAPDLPPIWANQDQMAQVVTNLTVNAINYTPDGQIRIRTELDEDENKALLQVQDTGIGIDPGDLPRLFQRFYRGRRAIESSAKGSGLGLSITKRIVELHGGEISVDSRPDEGSTFNVRLPIAG